MFAAYVDSISKLRRVDHNHATHPDTQCSVKPRISTSPKLHDVRTSYAACVPMDQFDAAPALAVLKCSPRKRQRNLNEPECGQLSAEIKSAQECAVHHAF